MKIHRLEGTDAFIVFDLDDAPNSVGATRLAPKILVDGAVLRARSITYLFATLEQPSGGASAGINTKADDRSGSVEAFVAEIEPLVAAGTFLTEPGSGLTADDLASLRAVDPRPVVEPNMKAALLGATVAVSAEVAMGGSGALDGATVAIEGLDEESLEVVLALATRGARIIGVGTAKGAAILETGFAPEDLVAAVKEHASGVTDHLGVESRPSWAIFGAPADILCVGSKTGTVNDVGAARITARALVPTGPVPVTAKALAMLRRSGTVVLPDFITTAGPLFAMFPKEGASEEDTRTTAEAEVADALTEVMGHADGPLLAACYRAESFLATWQDTLPFGRPLA